ncbi:MAG: DUF881 domain-containing protein [Clostridia bacterium]|nr:DUF881 domain-containing protein [Clostridia bacterium]
MKKEKIIITITVGIVCLLLVMTMFMQFKVVNQTDITSIETMTESELRSERNEIREKYEQLAQQYSETLVKLKDYKDEYKTVEETRDILKKELYQLKTLLGTINVEGPGIIITIKEVNVENDRITYEDLLVIVNALKGAGAEAISINNHRIVTTSYISDIGVGNNTYININGERVLAPYVIKAIGNQTYLESALFGSGGYVDELQKYGFDVEIERNNNTTIEAYTDEEIKAKYMN